MENITLEHKVRFYVSVERGEKEEIYTLAELGFTSDELKEMSNGQLEKQLKESYEDWKVNYVNQSWGLIEG